MNGIKEYANNGAITYFILEDGTEFRRYEEHNGVYKETYTLNNENIDIYFLTRFYKVLYLENGTFKINSEKAKQYLIDRFRSLAEACYSGYDKYSVLYVTKKAVGIEDTKCLEVFEHIQNARNYSNMIQDEISLRQSVSLDDLNYNFETELTEMLVLLGG